MNNNAFRDLVRSHGEKNSSKAIARKAVEDEFRKKKRKRSGDADSSSDEEDDDHNKYKKKGKQKEEKEPEEDDAEAIQKDLSSRYRDRAKERREGKADETTTEEASNNNFLIVPHNIKGLDLALARKEREALQPKSGGETRKIVTAVDAGEENVEGANKIRDKLPTLEQAHEILQAFLSRDKDKTTDDVDKYDFPTTISSGIVEYLGELFNWKTLDVSTFEAEGGAAGKSLQHTKFSLAIDGHPSDSLKAWQIPREYTLSRGGSSGGSSAPLLQVDLVNKIDAFFSRKNLIRDEMMERQTTTKSDPGRSKFNDTKRTQIIVDKDINSGGDDDESDDDMFA